MAPETLPPSLPPPAPEEKSVPPLFPVPSGPHTPVMFVEPKRPPPATVRETNPAEWTFLRLVHAIREFEKRLDNDHEVGARLVTFGNNMQFHIQDIGWSAPDIIVFHGVTDQGEPVQLIQNIAQLNVLLIGMRKSEPEPRRIGFRLGKDQA